MTDPVTSLHYAPNNNLVDTNGVETYAPGVDGFNLADVSSLAELNALPAGVKGLVYLNMTDGVTAAFEAAVDQYIGDPKLYGFYVADQPTTVPAATLKAEADYIYANVPGAVTFMWIENMGTPTSPVYNLYNPQNTDIELFGISPQPVRPQFSGGMDLSVIPDAVNAAVAGGIPLADIVPIYQAFGGSGTATYTLPTAAQEEQILSTWGQYVPTPAFDFAYSWGLPTGYDAISDEPSLQQVFAAANAQTASAPAAPTITSPASGSTDTTTAEPVISGTGVTGDTVSVSIDGVAAGTAVVSNSAWSFTPTSPLTNASHTVSATQAATGGTSSAAATDTFTVNVATAAPAAPTITSPASGSTDTTTAEPVISGTGVSGDTVSVSIDGSVVGTALVSGGNWSYTPTSALTNASHTVTATQAASGGPSSASSSADTFTVNISSGGGGETISTAVGQQYLTAANNPLTITSTGSVTTTASGDAISAPSGTAWQINNAGTISGVVGSSSAGIYSPASGIAVQNTGKISGYVAGLWLSDGGSVTNGATGVISATSDYGVYIAGAAGTVTNAGTITGPSGAVDLAFSSASNRVVVAPGAVFNGTVSGGSGTLELASGASSGAITGLGTNYTNFAALVVDAGASWTLSGSNTIASITDDGSLVITGALPAATFQIGAAGGGGTLEVASAPGTASPISFLGASKLIIDSAAAFGSGVGGASYAGPLLEDFVSGDTIDIKNVSATNATSTYNATTGLLQIVSGSQTATLDFQNSTLGSSAFSLTSDGASGLDVTLSQGTAPAAPTITAPASGSTDTTTAEPVISGTGVSGDTVSVSIDGATVGTAPVIQRRLELHADESARATPATPISATQAATGGPSSTAATDTFTVNVAASAPAAPTITSPASGSTDTTTAEPVISGTGVSGDTVSVSIDGAAVGTALVSNGAWSYTPTSPLSNASHTISATQAATGGTSSTAATDTFTVNVAASAPAAPTISSPASGSTDTTTAEPVISGTGVSGDTVSVSIDGASVGTAVVTGGAWSYTPTCRLSNASHTISATQAATGGPSSAAATDTFTVNVSGGLTISTATTGPLTLAAKNNPVTITSTGSVKATASGADAIDGAAGTSWSITNAGTISSSQQYGVSFKGSGGSIVNSGTISGYSGSGGYGVDFEDGGTITNASTGSVTGGEDAVFVWGAAGTINNSGTISSSFDDGIGLFAGGSVINNAGGVIKTPTSGGYGPAAIYIPSGSASVVNHGTISGEYGVYYQVAGTVENAGTISGTAYAVDFSASSSANKLIVDPGAIFNGGVYGGGGAMELTAGTGSIGLIGSSAFSDFTTLTDDTGANWTLTGANTIANVVDNGGITVSLSLDVSSAVNAASTGQFDLAAGGSLEVAADAATHSQIAFLGASELTIDSASLFGTGAGTSSYAGPLIEDFVAGDTIDLKGYSATGASLAYSSTTGLLQITNSAHAVATLDFQNSSLSATGAFSIASDGSSGVKITHS